MDLAIGNHQPDVREAWLICLNDPDGSILDDEDPPFVPMDRSDPPALKAREWLAQLKKEKIDG